MEKDLEQKKVYTGKKMKWRIDQKKKSIMEKDFERKKSPYVKEDEVKNWPDKKSPLWKSILSEKKTYVRKKTKWRIDRTKKLAKELYGKTSCNITYTKW